MKKQIGKLYWDGATLIIMCTGLGEEDKRNFEGVVVMQTDSFSDHKFGNYSKTWSGYVFNEYGGVVVIDNSKWKERVEIGECNG